jgi:hypothetical protein
MSTLENYKKIPKDVASKDDLDFEFLKSKGIEYIESMGGGLWSDYNDHDPGVTMLEVLSYAITDLGARIDLPIQDILASENDSGLRDQFYRAEEILPSCPVTALDYRKLFLDVPGVRNCWIIKYEQLLHIDCDNDVLSYFEFPENNTTFEQTSLPLQGLNCILVDFNDEIDELIVVESIKAKYHENRNLCEDLVLVKPVVERPIAVCATIDIDQEADEDYIHAQVIETINQYFSPHLNRYSLKEMLDRGYRMEEIFEGPFLENGFIDSAELIESELRSEVRLSDIVRLIMSIEGVLTISTISIDGCNAAEKASDWLICLEGLTRPKLAPSPDDVIPEGETCELRSVFNYRKDVLPVAVNKDKFDAFILEFKEARDNRVTVASLNMIPEIPEGAVLGIGDYTTVQNDFPETYGIGVYGLNSNASTARKAQAKQLKAYLLFFDQILASYFAHLDKVKELFSMNTGNSPSYFSQAVKDLRGMDEIVKDYPTDDNILLSQKLISPLDSPVARRNEVLDHLLSRFAENFSEFAFLTKELYKDEPEGTADLELIKSKEQFLAEYVELSSRRGKGYNCLGVTWDTENVSGVQHRVSRLAGIPDYSRRDLIGEYPGVFNTLGGIVWGINQDVLDGDVVVTADAFETPIGDESEIFLRSAAPSSSTCEAYENRKEAIRLLAATDTAEIEAEFLAGVVNNQIIGNIKLIINGDSSGSYIVLDASDVASLDFALGDVYANLDDIEAAIILHITAFSLEENSIKLDPTVEEGMYIIENLLIRPEFIEAAVKEPIDRPITKDETILYDDYEVEFTPAYGEYVPTRPEYLSYPFMGICSDGCNDKCALDPYSFKAQVILPGTGNRFSNPDFRNFMESLIQAEFPSHIIPRICWISECQMSEFQVIYHEYLDQKAIDDISPITLAALITILSELRTINPKGRLHDCETDDFTGKVVLGRSNI